jgi:hypothetical protein
MAISEIDRKKILASIARAFLPLIVTSLLAEEAADLPADDMIGSLYERLPPSAQARVAAAIVRASPVMACEIYGPLKRSGRIFGISASKAAQMIIFEACAWVCRQLWKVNRWPDRAVLDMREAPEDLTD